MNEKQKSIKASSKVIAVLMKIGYIAMIVEICMCTLSMIFIKLTGKTSFTTSGGMKILTPVVVSDMSAGSVMATCTTLLVIGIFLFMIFLITCRMFEEISKTCNPFNEKYIKKIKAIGILVIAMTVIGSTINSISASIAETQTLDICNDSTGLIFGVIIYCLAYIFDYGCMLQKQSDETL